MSEDRNKTIKFIIIIMFVVIVILLLVRFIGSLTSSYRDSKQTVVENSESIENYIVKEDIITDTEIKEANLVKDYQTFYTVQNAFNNFIDALINGKYSDTYSITTQDIKSKYDRNTYIGKIKDFTEINFLSNDKPYVNSSNLKFLYTVKEDAYIGEIVNANGDLVKIGVILNRKDSTYKVFYIDMDLGGIENE